MNENTNENREFDFFDMMKALAGKWKMLLCLTLVAVIVGGAFGLVSALPSNNCYGGTVEFYVYSDAANDYILSLVKSDKFSELLLLNEYGLPEEYKDLPEYKEKYAELLAVKVQIEALREEIDLIKRENQLADYNLKLTLAERALEDAKLEYEEIYNLITTYKLAENVTDPDNHNAQIKIFEKRLEEKREARDAAKKAYDDIYLEKKTAEKKLEYARRDLKNLREDIEEPLDEFLADFRSEKKNIEDIKRIKNCVTFEYEEKTVAASSNKTEVKDLSSEALLRVTVSVPGDEEFAARIVDELVEKLPEFVEEEAFFDFNSTQTPECAFISTFSTAEKLPGDSLVKAAAIYGVIGGMVMFFVSGMVVILVELFKRRSKENVDEAN